MVSGERKSEHEQRERGWYPRRIQINSDAGAKGSRNGSPPVVEG